MREQITTTRHDRPCRAALRHRILTATAVLVGATVGSTGASHQTAHAALTSYEAPYLRLEIAPNDITGDPTREVFYASVKSTDPRYADQVVTVDPVTGDVIAAASIGATPNALAMTDDGAALYVGVDGERAVKKLSLPSLAVVWTYPIPADPFFGPSIARDLAVPPGIGNTVAIALRRTLSSSPAGIVIVDGAPGGTAVARAATVPGTDAGDAITYGASPSVLYGADRSTSANSFFRYAVSAGGVAVIDDTPVGGEELTFHAGLVYSSSGGVVDPNPTPPVFVHSFQPAVSPTVDGLAIDATTNQVHVYKATNRSPGGLIGVITDYDLATREPLREWRIPLSVVPVHFVGAGSRYFAFANQFGAFYLTNLTEPVDLGSLGEYAPLTPERILDTRTGLGRDGVPGRVGAGQSIDVQVTGVGGIPGSGVSAVVMNVTAVFPTSPGYLTVFPTGIERPTISNLNFEPNTAVANLVTMPVGAGGKVSVFNPYGEVDVLFDVAGFYAAEDGPAGLRFHPTEPTRIMDTRNGVGGRRGALGTADATTLRVGGRLAVPSGAQAVAVNVTVTGTTEPSFLTLFPSDVALPTVSNVNFGGAATIANQAIVRLSSSGDVTVYNQAGQTDVVIDVVGYYDDVRNADFGRFITVTPERLVDTRTESPFPPPGNLLSGDILVLGREDQRLSALVLNVTVTETQGFGYVTTYPYTAGSRPPMTSTLNYAPGQTVPNHAIVRTGPQVGFYDFGGSAHLVVDIFGVFI